jgi:hypothetical protein
LAAGCALINVGCQPMRVVQPAGAAPAPQTLFGAPPVVSGQGVMVDPFAANPNGPTAVAPPLGPDMPPSLVPGGSSQIHVPVLNRDWTWEQIVDTVDDYFRIERERQVQLVGDVLTEGRIDTLPQIGATILEPHRRDSVGKYNRWESTFQTIRRRATLRVIPDANGYIVDCMVEKDLEDLPRPEQSTAGSPTFRNDDSIARTPLDQVSHTRLSGNWILVGRDPALEQRILADIQSRLSVQPTP